MSVVQHLHNWTPTLGYGVFSIVACPASSVLVSTDQAYVSGDPVQVSNNYAFQAELSAYLADVRPAAKAKLDLANKFNMLAAQWKKERGISSSLSKAAFCPSYQKIIGLGPAAIPLIFERLQEEGDHPDFWFWALECLTGENPVPEDDRGDFRAMAKAWLDWSRCHAKLGAQ